MPHTIALNVVSLRKASFNRRVAEALTRLPSAQGRVFAHLEIGDLPLYNQDDDASQPAATLRLKAQVRDAAGIVFVTPEYNRSIPGVLKNALDHGSRPFGTSAWSGKPAGVIGASPGAAGTAMAQQHLRNVLASLDMVTLGQPEAFIQWKDDSFAPDGTAQGRTAQFLDSWLTAFLRLVDSHPAR